MKQKISNTNSTSAKIGLFIGVGILALLLFQYFAKQNPKFVRYNEFGISIPLKYELHGIDVSHHNNTIDWNEVHKMNIRGVNISFTFIKATQGINNDDEQFLYNWKQSKKNNIIRGAYHYFNELESGKEQAEHFIQTVGHLLPNDLPPVLDIEENKTANNDTLKMEALIWLKTIENYYKIKPIIYTYVHFYKNYLDKNFDKYPLWAAHYTNNQQPDIDRDWLFWQHSESGKVNGITEPVDFNVFNGNLADLKNILVK